MTEKEKISENDLIRIRDAASEYVKEAGRYFFDAEKIRHVSEKSRKDFVTQADTTVQEYLRKRLEELLPEAQFMGEEQNNSHIDFKGLYWILDPVDGTTNLSHGFRHSAVSLALALGPDIILGIVYDPYTSELFSAVRGGGAFLNGQPIHVSGRTDPADSLVLVGTAPARRELTDIVFRRIRTVYDNCLDIRRAGSAALDLCFIASGRADAYYEEILQPWDYAAGTLIALEAGASVTAVDATPLPLHHGSSIFAAGSGLYEKLRSILVREEV